MRRCQIQSAPSNDRWPNGTRENGKPTFRPDSVPDLTTTIFITSRSAFPDATIIKALFVSELQKLLSDARAQPSDGPAERGRVGLAFASPEHLFADDASGRCLSIRALRLLLTRVYGPDDETLSKQLRRLESLCSTFLELYGDGPANLLRAPARINVLGEHVDYVSYLPTASLPFASREHDMLMLYTPNDSDHVRGASTCKDYPPFNFVLSDGPDYEMMRDFRGRALVAWGTQPVLRARTIARAVKLAALFDENEMIVPTALKERPYAPIARDAAGRVSGARETYTEKTPALDFGETNTGFFVLDSQAMFRALLELRQRHWIESAQRYDRPGGELGFPNELINYFAGRGSGVIACPFVDPREEQGIKTFADVARCERFISELRDEEA